MKTKQQLLKFKTKMDAKLHEVEKKREITKRDLNNIKENSVVDLFFLFYISEKIKNF